jgi:predicted XRE-type DNA-binding protein
MKKLTDREVIDRMKAAQARLDNLKPEERAIFERINNEDIKRQLRRVGIFQYELAAALGISEPKLSAFLRSELSSEETKELVTLIDKLAEAKWRPQGWDTAEGRVDVDD